MRNMLPLRCIALAANVSFIVYGAFVPVYPMLVLHLSLLPLNLYRLIEILKSMRRMREATSTDLPIDAIRPFLKPRHFSEGDVIFLRGDPPDHVYFLEKGSVELPEIGETLTDGTLFGEMAYFTRARQRTTSAVCTSDCKIMTIDERSFMGIYRQHPEFGHFIISLIAQRLVEGSQKKPELYKGFSEDAAE